MPLQDTDKKLETFTGTIITEAIEEAHQLALELREKQNQIIRAAEERIIGEADKYRKAEIASIKAAQERRISAKRNADKHALQAGQGEGSRAYGLGRLSSAPEKTTAEGDRHAGLRLFGRGLSAPGGHEIRGRAAGLRHGREPCFLRGRVLARRAACGLPLQGTAHRFELRYRLKRHGRPFLRACRPENGRLNLNS